MKSQESIKIVGGRWRVIQELGAGAMGRVLLAEGDDGGQVAIKLLGRSDSSTRAHRIQSFKSEFSILKELSHPGINRVYDFGLDVDSGYYYFTTEFIDGAPFLGSLENANVDEIEDLFVQLLRALQYLHSHGIMHSDIKSANALVCHCGRQATGDSRQEVKLIDFGLAVLGTPDRIMGTPSYMAPEIILKSSPDSRADLYSLGVLIYAALTKFNPFRAGSMNEVFQRQLHVKPEPPSSYNHKVPKYLDDILLKLLEKSPADRFPTAAHVIRAIDLDSKRSWPVETKETFLAYLPTEGNLVGRKVEVEKLKDQCLAIRDGRDAPFALCVTGEMGVGRKRLLAELKYFAQLGEMEAISLGAVDETDLAEFNDKISKLMEGDSRPAVVICNVMGMLAIRKSSMRTIHLLEKLVRWMRMSDALSQVKKSTPVLLAFVAAPDELPLLMHVLNLEKDEINEVGIGNLSRDETGEYLAALTGVTDVPDDLTDELYNRTDGNPLFITEVMKGLVAGGMLFDKVGRWNREAIEDIGVHFEQLKVPGSLDGILDRTYKGALPDERAAMEALAVWRRPVTVADVSVVTGLENPRKVFVSLIKSGVVGFDASRATYSFSNALLRDVVYEKMSRERRGCFHRAIIERLEMTGPDAGEEINWHRGKSEDAKEAVDALIDLGLHHTEGGRALDAVSIFNEAVERSEKEKYRLDEVLLHLGESYVLARRYPDAIGIYEKLLRRQESGGAGVPERILTCQRLGVARLRNGEIERGREVLNEARKLLGETSGQVTMQQRIENFLARADFLEGKLEDAAGIYRETKEKWKKLPVEEKGKVLNNDLAHVYLQMGKLDQAEREFDDDVKFFEEVGADRELERSYYAMAEIHMQRGDLERAPENFERAIEIAKRISDSEILLRAYNGMGTVFGMKGDIEKGIYWYERALDLAVRTGEDSTAAGIALNIGLMKSKEGLLDQALEHFNSSVKIFNQAAKKTGLDLAYLLRTYVELADVHRLKKEYDRSEHFLGEAKEIAESFPALSDHVSLIEKVAANLAADRGEKVLPGAGPPAGHEEISILDVKSGDDRTEEDTMDSKNYRYILEINKYLGGEADLDFVLRTILKYALELSGAGAGLILLVNEEGGLEIKSSCNIEVDENLSEVGSSIAKSAMEKNEIVMTENALGDDRFRSMESVIVLELKSVMCIPIHARKKVVGVLYLENRAREAAFAFADSEVLSAFADQTGIAIENARLIEGYESTGKKLKDELSESQLEMEKLDVQLRSQASDLKGTCRFDRLSSASPKMKTIFDLLKRISGSELSVCITGESGTGKELVARAVHYSSGRSEGPFIVINCGAIPATLIESELFGCRAGAYTGAVKDRIGLFEAANGGTIFLDEIAELDISLQAKLLRVIQEREVMRVGDTKTIKCDVRILCATNKVLEDAVGDASFRQDLFYRIAEVRIDLPPLRERTEDVPVLIDEFVSDYCEQHKIKKLPSVNASFVRACMSYDWPGNIRELENAVRVACALADERGITLESLPDNHVLKRFSRGAGGAADINVKDEVPPFDGFNRYDPKKSWKEYEAEIIASCYKSCGFNAKETAENLKIAVATVYKKINELGLKDKGNPLFSTSFKYESGTALGDYIVKIFRAAWEAAGRKPYKSAKLLGVSHGYFYKVMKRF